MLFTNRELTKIIVPLIIEQFLAVTIGMLDTVMVARAGEAAVSGVSLVDSVNLLMVYTFSALASGGAVTISQLIGAGKKDKTNNAAKQLVWVVFLVSATVMTAVLVLRKQLLSFIFGSVPQRYISSLPQYHTPFSAFTMQEHQFSVQWVIPRYL